MRMMGQVGKLQKYVSLHITAILGALMSPCWGRYSVVLALFFIAMFLYSGFYIARCYASSDEWSDRDNRVNRFSLATWVAVLILVIFLVSCVILDYTDWIAVALGLSALFVFFTVAKKGGRRQRRGGRLQ